MCSPSRAFANDDENVMHLTVVERWAEFLDPVDDEGVRVVGVQRDRVRDLFAAVPNMGIVTRVLPPVWFGTSVTVGNKRQ